MIKLYLVPGKYTEKGRLYSVLYEGEVLVKKSYDPEYSACRALVQRGMTGKVGFFTSQSEILRAFVPCLVHGAGLRTSEGNKASPVTKKFVPFSERQKQ